MNEDALSFIEELKQRPDVSGIILFGSQARGSPRPDSDIDLIVILDKGFQRTVEYRNRQAFEIIYTTEQEAFAFWESHRDDAYGLWEIAKILYDRDGSIRRLQNRAKKMLSEGKPPMDEMTIVHYRFDAEDQLRYVEGILDSDPASAQLVLANKVSALTELFFDVRQMWVPAPKQRLQKIKETSPELYALIQQFYQEDTPLTEKPAIARRIVTLVFEKAS